MARLNPKYPVVIGLHLHLPWTERKRHLELYYALAFLWILRAPASRGIVDEFAQLSAQVRVLWDAALLHRGQRDNGDWRGIYLQSRSIGSGRWTPCLCGL